MSFASSRHNPGVIEALKSGKLQVPSTNTKAPLTSIGNKINKSDNTNNNNSSKTMSSDNTDSKYLSTDGPEGCYLTFEPDSGGRLMLFYSKGEIPKNAVGFWCPGPNKTIQGFKFKQNGGRSELIKGIAGGDSNRRKYFSGWCQFIKLARAMNGYVIKFPLHDHQGVEVDVVAYHESTNQPYELDLDEGLVEVSKFDAIAVIPKHNTTFRGIKSIVVSNFLELGNIAGASSKML